MGDWSVRPYIDGGDASSGVNEVMDAWGAEWRRSYASATGIQFLPFRNLNEASHRTGLPPEAHAIGRIRNPDALFVLEDLGIELGNLEITTHSPDGSNIEKRYPLLYASRRRGVDAIVATPYQKWRGPRQTNRLPHRHASRNVDFLYRWDPADPASGLAQLLPIAELHGAELSRVDDTVRDLIPPWADIGRFFAHRMALRLEVDRSTAVKALEAFAERLLLLHEACLRNTRDTEPASLHKDGDRWVQVYNTRPETGHWERGEGQFDSIDGRLMFTIDGIDLLEPAERPTRLDFLLPQLSSGHPWVVEQRERGYGSKRFRNVCQILPQNGLVDFSVLFADDLTANDWRLLQQHPGLCLERLDRAPGVYSLVDLLAGSDVAAVAASGLRGQGDQAELVELLSDEHLHWSTHRGYLAGWEQSLTQGVRHLSSADVVLCPRLPGRLLRALGDDLACRLVSAEDCTKNQLLALRQIDRHRSQ